MPLSGYLLREISADCDLRTQEGRSQLLQRAQPLLTAVVAPTTALLLRKEVSALAGVSQAELEALYDIKAVARAPRPALQKSPGRGIIKLGAGLYQACTVSNGW